MKKTGYRKIELTPVSELDEEDQAHTSNTLVNTRSPLPQYFDSSDSDSMDENLESYLTDGRPISDFSVSIGSRRANKKRKRRQRHYADADLGDLDPYVETNDVIGEIITNPKFYFCAAFLCCLALVLIICFSMNSDIQRTSNSKPIVNMAEKDKNTTHPEILSPVHTPQLLRNNEIGSTEAIENKASVVPHLNLFTESSLNVKIDYVKTIGSMRKLIEADEASCFYVFNRYTMLYGTTTGQIWIVNLTDEDRRPKQGQAKLLHYTMPQVEIAQLVVDFKGRVVFSDVNGNLHILEENKQEVRLNKISKKILNGQWFEINKKGTVLYFWSSDKNFEYFTQLNLNPASQSPNSGVELDIVKTPLKKFNQVVFKIDSLRKRAIFVDKERGIFTKDLTVESFTSATEGEDHGIDPMTKKGGQNNSDSELTKAQKKKKAAIRFKGRTTQLKYDIVAIDSYLSNLVIIKKIYQADNHTYNYSLQLYVEKNNFFYLHEEHDLKQLIVYPHEMIFEGKLKIVGRMNNRLLLFLSFKHIIEDMEYIYNFNLDKEKRLVSFKQSDLTEIFQMKWQDYLMSFNGKNRVEFSTLVLGSERNSPDTDLWLQKMSQDQTKSFFDRFHYDWLYNVKAVSHKLGAGYLLLGTSLGEIYKYSFEKKKIETLLATRGRHDERQMKLTEPVWVATGSRNNLVFAQRNSDIISTFKKGLSQKSGYLIKDMYHYNEKVVRRVSKDGKLLFLISNEMPTILKVVHLTTRNVFEIPLEGMNGFKNAILDFDIDSSFNEKTSQKQDSHLKLYALIQDKKSQNVLIWERLDQQSKPIAKLIQIHLNKPQGSSIKVTPLKSITLNQDGTLLALNGSKRLTVASIANRQLTFLIDEENPEKIDFEGDQVEVNFFNSPDQFKNTLGTACVPSIYEKSVAVMSFQMFFRAKGDYEIHYMAVQTTDGNEGYNLKQISKEIHVIDEFWQS